MQEPDNFHSYCFEIKAVKVFNRASVNKMLTKYFKSINQVFGSTCTKNMHLFHSDISIYLVIAQNQVAIL